MKKLIIIAFMFAGVGTACPAFAADAVVARVNGAAITSDAVTNMMSRVKAGKGHGAEAARGKDALRKEALDRAILEELAYQKAKADGMSASPEEINRTLEELRARMGGAEGLKNALEKEKWTEESLLADIGRDIVLRRIFAREVTDKVVVPEEAVEKEYESEKDKYVIPEKVAVDDIVFFLNPGESASVAKADSVRRKVLEDKDRNPRNLEPDGTFIVQDLEVHPDRQIEIYREAMKLKAGELSGVVETGDSLHVIRLKEYSPKKQLSLEQVRGLLERKLTAEARKERLRQWDAELRRGATIEIMGADDRNP